VLPWAVAKASAARMASSSTGRPFSFEDGPYGVPHTDVPVAEHDLVPGLDGEPRDGTADVSASDESHSRQLAEK
jgi:hypothetical protein